MCKEAHYGFLLVIFKGPYCANFSLPIMCFWPVSECPRSKQKNPWFSFLAPLLSVYLNSQFRTSVIRKKRTDYSTRLVNEPLRPPSGNTNEISWFLEWYIVQGSSTPFFLTRQIKIPKVDVYQTIKLNKYSRFQPSCEQMPIKGFHKKTTKMSQ